MTTRIGSDRPLSSGSVALDDILGGGFPQGSVNVIAGAPGTGKTALAQQTIFANTSDHLRALYLTTFSEPLPKVIRYLERFDFYDRDRMYSAVSFRDVGQTLRERGVAALPEAVAEMLEEGPYGLLVIDSLKALHDIATDISAFRLAIFDMASHLAATGTTALWLGEYAPERIADFAEFAVADGVLELHNRAHGVRSERTIRVTKMRGALTVPGEHTFRISKQGVDAFPRLAVSAGGGSGPWTPERVSSGVSGFDALVGGGLWRTSVTLVVGPSGAGKTTFALSFVAGGADRGEAGLVLTMQEREHELRSVLTRMSAAHGRVTIDRHDPLEADLVEILIGIKERVINEGVRRLVIDGLGDLRDAAIEPSRLRATVYNLAEFCRARNISLVLTTELPLSGALELDPDLALPSMTDNLLVVQYGSGAVARTLEVVKTRFSMHAIGRHAASIDDLGFHVTVVHGDSTGVAPERAVVAVPAQ